MNTMLPGPPSPWFYWRPTVYWHRVDRDDSPDRTRSEQTRMQLAQPEWLWFLTALPPLAVWGALGRARREREWSALGLAGRPAWDGSRFWLLAAAILIVALARPRWGRLDRPPLPPGHDVVLAIDVSRSMGAGDAVPDRLGRGGRGRREPHRDAGG